jgi:hypothetical protein
VSTVPSASEWDLAEVVAEVEGCFLAYEEALAADDLDALDEAFVRSERTVRYGVADAQYGHDEIRAWRRSAGGIPRGRTLGPTFISTFGRDVAVVCTEFRYAGSALGGRQSQTWVKFDFGWKVVTAHVSLVAPH